MDLSVVVIRPKGFRPRKGARKSYTQPAYLICTDPTLPIEDILQEYVWRWDIVCYISPLSKHTARAGKQQPSHRQNGGTGPLQLPVCCNRMISMNQSEGLREATAAVCDCNTDTINLSGWTINQSSAESHLNNHRNLSKVRSQFRHA